MCPIVHDDELLFCVFFPGIPLMLTHTLFAHFYTFSLYFLFFFFCTDSIKIRYIFRFVLYTLILGEKKTLKKLCFP